MTQTSYFHNGSTRGDAVYSPYAAETFSSILNTIYQSDGAYVIPNSLYTYNVVNLMVSSVPSREVSVYEGKAFIAGILYTNSGTVTLSLNTNTSLHPRIDRVVIRVNWATKTAALAVVEGIPAELPVPPALKEIPGVVYEMSLARVYLASGYSTTTNNVVDERKFANTTAHENYHLTRNVLPNSEFMALNASNWIPTYWTAIGSPSMDRGSKFSQMPRGQTVKITTATNGVGMYTGVNLRGPSAVSGSNRVLTMRMLVKPVTGCWSISMYTDGTHIGTTYVYPSPDPQEVLIRSLTYDANSRLHYIYVQSVDNTGGSVYIGHTTISYGFIPAPLIETHETIIYDEGPAIEVPANGAMSTQVTTGYTNHIPPGARAVIVALPGYDTSSSTGTSFASFQSSVSPYANYVRLELTRLANSAYREVIGIVPLEEAPGTGYNYQFRLSVTAASGSSFNLGVIRFRGVIT